MNVLLTGATGFVGTHVLSALLDEGHSVRCLVRSSSDTPLPTDRDGVTLVEGDVTRPDSLKKAVAGCEAVVHLVGIIDEKPSAGLTFERIHVEGTRNVVDAAQKAGVEKFIHMSANGARPHGRSLYETTKWRAEQHVKGAGFDWWTIFRPSIVFGDPGPHNISFEVRLSRELVKPFPILPVFGDGTYRLQPVDVSTVAEGFALALTTDSAQKQVYHVGGLTTLTYNEVLDRIAHGMGIAPKPKLHVPMALSRLVIETIGRLGILPISPAQFYMLTTGNTCDASDFFEDFGLEPEPFDGRHLGYLQERV